MWVDGVWKAGLAGNMKQHPTSSPNANQMQARQEETLTVHHHWSELPCESVRFRLRCPVETSTLFQSSFLIPFAPRIPMPRRFFFAAGVLLLASAPPARAQGPTPGELPWNAPVA